MVDVTETDFNISNGELKKVLWRRPTKIPTIGSQNFGITQNHIQYKQKTVNLEHGDPSIETPEAAFLRGLYFRGDRIGRQRGYTAEQTQALKDKLSSVMEDEVLSIMNHTQSYNEEQFLSILTHLYISDNIKFHRIMTAEFTALVNAFLQLNGTHITEADMDLLVEAFDHPEYEAIIALYVRNHEESGLTFDELIAFLVDDVSNPCPTETGVLEEAMQQNGPVV